MAFNKGHIPWNKGSGKYNGGKRFEKGCKKSLKAHCFEKGHTINLGRPSSKKGKKLSKILAEKSRKAHLIGLLKQQNMKGPTCLEKILYEYLSLKNILFEKQKLINNRFLVDAYISSLNLVIEVDGKYWHNLDRVKKKDKAENAYLKKCGYNLIRLSEQEIKDRSFKERMVF
jgi:very-short-patch-repair endonuclease